MNQLSTDKQMETEVPEKAAHVQSVEALHVSGTSKALDILYDPQSPDLEIPDDLVLENIL